MKPTIDQIAFRPFLDSDVAHISKLITGMSNDSEALRLRDKSADYFRWMYFDNPAGPAFGCIAQHNERTVSSFAVAPKLMQIRGKRVRVGKTMDMFTDPDYQGMGLIKQCADRVFAAARDAGIDGWYVTPSENSYPIFRNKWGYREDLRVVYRTRVLDIEAVSLRLLPKRAHAVGRLADRLGRLLPARSVPSEWAVTELTSFDRRADELWDEVSGGYGVAIVRDARYLNWRYVDNPDEYVILGIERDGTLRGILVLKTTIRKGLAVGEIVDLVAPREDRGIIGVVLRAAITRCRELGCALVEVWGIRGTLMDRQFIRAGIAIPRTTMKFLISPDYPDPLIYDPNAWLLTQGDGNDV